MIGETLGRYRIVEAIGSGGMGIVYRAHDPTLDRDVALKLLHSEVIAGESARDRFLREARALSHLNHPHICTVHEIDEADGHTFIAMEYVRGRQLSEVIPHDGLPLETLVRYGIQIADAIGHAHEHGIVHRDLKSANVVITPDGHVKVLDFGIARHVDCEHEGASQTQEGITQPGVVMGTPGYMAPEVLVGKPADARADIWALGVILHEMATGALPFTGPTPIEFATAILKEPPHPCHLGFRQCCAASSNGVWPRSRDGAITTLAKQGPHWKRSHPRRSPQTGRLTRASAHVVRAG